jgi:hypothetical protein
LKLAGYFEHTPDSEQQPFTPKSQWHPPKGKLPPEINTVVDADILHFQTKFKIGRLKENLSTEEFEALSSLKNNTNVIIKPADKGSAIIIMDREQYLWAGYRQLNDGIYYSKLK